MEWGVKANLAEPRSAMRTGALVWVVLTNPGWGGERLCVLARSRGGRLITTWIGTKRLTNMRAAWMPEHLRKRCHTWETKEAAAEWATAKQATLANAALTRRPLGPSERAPGYALAPNSGE